MIECGTVMMGGLAKYSSGGDDLFGYRGMSSGTDKINPLDAFVYSSADSLAERILWNVKQENIETAKVDKYLSAGFVEQLP